MNHENAFRDPFAEIHNRHEDEWRRLFLAEPELLDHVPGNSTGAEAPPFSHASFVGLQARASTQELASPSGSLIRCWEEIPDLFAMPAPATEWIVEGLLPRGSVTLIAGEPGSYKTWLALALLRGVARPPGGIFLGRKCAQTSVLYLDRENPLAVVRERLAVLGIDASTLAGPSAGADSRIWGGWLADPPPPIGDIRLLEIARARRPLIIFDSLIRFHMAADENSASEMSTVMGDLRALANAGATVVALHHKPKSEGAHYRGSSDIAGGVDMAWAVSRDRTAGLLRVECFKSRYAEEFSLTLRPELGSYAGARHEGPPGRRRVEPGEFIVCDSPDAASEQSDIERLADAIRRNPGQSRGRVIQDSGVADRRARSLLERHDGDLWHSRRGLHNSIQFFPGEARLNENTGNESDT